MTATGPAGLGQGLGGGGRYPMEGRYVCPFCGAVNETMDGPCPNCTMTNTADTRKATKSRIGPWYVLQSRNPAAPGMRYETLLGFVRKGRVKARSIVRGPTTHQLWRFACQVKGLSREFGLCYSCGGSIEREAQLCPQCNRLQDPPPDPDVFLENQAVAAAPESLAQSGVARPVAPAEALQETRQGAIFKELKLPPVADFPSIAPPAAAAPPPAPAAPAPVLAASAATPAPIAPSPATPPEPAVSPAPPPSAPPAGAQPAAAAAAAAAGERVPKRNANDVFLSAKDLAAAFQLGFDGDGDTRNHRGAGADRDPPWGGSSDWAGQPARPTHRRPRRKRRVGRAILLVLLLVVGGIAVYLAVDAAARNRVFAWGEAKYMALTGANFHPDLSAPNPTQSPPARGPLVHPASTRNSTSPIPASPGASATPASGLTTGLPESAPPAATKAPPPPAAQASGRPPASGAGAEGGAGSGAAETARYTPSPVTPPAPATTNATANSANSANSTPASTAPAPGNSASGAAQEARPAGNRASPRPAPPTQPARPSDQPAPQQRETARLSLDEARRRSAELWKEALTAEEANDYRKAKALYEQMMKLPREVWYQGIEGRLKYAKEMLGEK